MTEESKSAKGRVQIRQIVEGEAALLRLSGAIDESFTGFDLLPRLRAYDGGRVGRLPAIAVTALAGEADRRRAIDAGFDAHLAKPADVRDVLRAIARLAGRLD